MNIENFKTAWGVLFHTSNKVIRYIAQSVAISDDMLSDMYLFSHTPIDLLDEFIEMQMVLFHADTPLHLLVI